MNGKGSINLFPITGIALAFLALKYLPPLYPSAGGFAAPLVMVLTVSACILIFVPGVALLALAGERVPRSLSPGVVMIGSAAGGWLLFWAWFAQPYAGVGASMTLLVSSTFILGAKFKPALWKDIAAPAVVSVLVSAGYLSLAGDRGGLNAGDDLVANRYWAVGDNAIPRLFADGLINNKTGLKPFLVGDWHSSDRPPLQTGMIMSAYPFVEPAGSRLAYLCLTVAVNIFWIWGLWGFLRAIGLSERKILQLMLLIILVGAIYVNSVYTWPKMLDTGLALTAGTVLLAGNFSKTTKIWIAGSATALSLLAHGTGIFALLGFIPLWWQRRQEWRWPMLAMTALVAMLIYLPWVAYQKFYDPPGDRLIKFHLAGVIPVEDRRSPSRAIIEEYRKAGWPRVLANKINNVRLLAGDPTARNGAVSNVHTQPGWESTFIGRVRQFFILRFAPAPAFLLAALPLLFFRKINQAVWFKPLFLSLSTTLLFFSILEFGSIPECSTWLWHAPYTALLLWCALCALAVTEAGEKLYLVFLVIQLVFFAALWDYDVGMWSALGRSSENPGQPDYIARLLALVSFLLLAVNLWKPGEWLFRLNHETRNNKKS